VNIFDSVLKYVFQFNEKWEWNNKNQEDFKRRKNEFKINIHKKSKEFDEISLLNKGSSISIILEYEW